MATPVRVSPEPQPEPRPQPGPKLSKSDFTITLDESLWITQEGSHSWFKKWIKYQRIFGLTYRGSCKIKSHICYWKKILLISYDLLITIGLSSYFFYNYIYNDSTIFKDNMSEKILIRVIIKVGCIASSIQFITFKMVLLHYGDQILKIIYSFRCPGNHGLKIFIRIVVLNALYVSLQVFGCMNIMDIKEFNHLSTIKDVISLCIQILAAIYSCSSLAAIMTLIYYSSNIISIQIKEATQQMKNGEMSMDQVSKNMLFIKGKLDQINSRLGIAIFMSFVTNGIRFSMCICLIAQYFAYESYSLMIVIGLASFVISGMLEIIVTCNASQEVINATETMCQAIKWKIVLSPVDDEDIKYAKIILSMRRKMRLKAMDFFGLKSATILTLVSYVGSYAVILIQTR